jgi:hypothetical protein
MIASGAIAYVTGEGLKGIVRQATPFLHCGKCETFQRFRVSSPTASGWRGAEHAAAEDLAHQRAPDGTLRNIVEAPPHASSAEQV